LAHSGFEALNDYRNTPDIFGRIMQVTQANIAEALAASSVVVMGEGAEQTPLAIINDVPFVHFQDRNPSKEELEALTISIEEDIYAPLLTSVTWKKGEGK
jgi:F420-0:gamma-glutamyl ligase